MKEYPVNGYALEKAVKWGNRPEIVFIYVGGSNLEPSKTPGIYYIALEYDQIPEELCWPVANTHSLLVWGAGPGQDIVKRVYDCVKASGAASVNVTVSVTDYDIRSTKFGASEDLELKKLQARAIAYEEGV